ncbi:hypothetical protein QU487_06325 [Crenobacter sp. SG2305]|uniref:hypothetical protein n=1 Tax=Crenobacter oryzisoli TaxID=3056844 RepID=UPI0025AA6C16|nr:hypothetical protein [Crenobacter sp. SG2305]MDN0082368.1 hypothetical protein [Crenobacter sp. SG2305]
MDLSELFGLVPAPSIATADLAPVLDLNFLFDAPRAPKPAIPPAAVPAMPATVAALPASTERYNGYANSRTWGMALLLSNDAQHYAEIAKRVRLDGTLVPADVEAYARSLNGKGGIELDEWMDGEIDWNEVAADFDADLPKGVATDLRQHIAQAQVEGQVVKLVQQLDRATYQKVNAILEGLGGKWSKKLKGHLFEDDPNDVIDTFLLTGQFPQGCMDPKKTFGFFPTPVELAKSVVALAGLTPGMTVLEPSAGSARLADEAAAIVGKSAVQCKEIQPGLAAKLRDAGYPVAEGDFLSMEPGEDDRVDAVVMNPPFSKRADLHHVMHATKWLLPGGRLVAIMSEGVMFRSTKLDAAFQALVAEYDGQFIPNPAGAFKESGTAVNTVTLVLTKPAC